MLPEQVVEAGQELLAEIPGRDLADLVTFPLPDIALEELDERGHDGRLEERRLGSKMGEQQALRNTGHGRDLPGSGAGETPLGEELAGGTQQERPDFIRGSPLPPLSVLRQRSARPPVSAGPPASRRGSEDTARTYRRDAR